MSGLDELHKIYNELTAEITQTGATLFGYSGNAGSHWNEMLHEAADGAGVKLAGRAFHEFKKTYITNLIVTSGGKLTTLEIAKLARCGVGVIEKHYFSIGTDRLMEILNGKVAPQ